MSALLDGPPRVVNIGLDLFARELERLGVSQIHVDWRPPAGADPHLASLLARLLTRRAEIEAANAVAIVLALFSFVIFSILFFARDWLNVE